MSRLVILSNEVDCASNVSAITSTHHEQRIIGHCLTDNREKMTIQIRRATLSAPGINIKLAERIPMFFGQVRTG